MSARRGGIPGRRWSDPEPCGTPAAYRRHLRHGENTCRSCRQAEQRRQAGRPRPRRRAQELAA